jgi:hypothetical protein
LIKISALFCIVMSTAVPDSEGAFAQNRGAVGRPGVAPNRDFGNFARFGGSFGWSRFGAGFGRDRRDFGPNVVVAPPVVAPAAPYYGVPPWGYDSLRCILHRQVETPYGLAVYVC